MRERRNRSAFEVRSRADCSIVNQQFFANGCDAARLVPLLVPSGGQQTGIKTLVAHAYNETTIMNFRARTCFMLAILTGIN